MQACARINIRGACMYGLSNRLEMCVPSSKHMLSARRNMEIDQKIKNN